MLAEADSVLIAEYKKLLAIAILTPASKEVIAAFKRKIRKLQTGLASNN